MHKVLVNRLGGLSLPRKSVVRLADRPYMTLDVYRGRKTTIQQQSMIFFLVQNRLLELLADKAVFSFYARLRLVVVNFVASYFF